MDTYSQIYIKSNFQDLRFWAGKCRKLLIFKSADFASEIAKNAFWRSFCSWKTPISWLVTIKWPLQTPMLVVVLMMINPIFFWCWNQQFWSFVNGFSLNFFIVSNAGFWGRFVLSPLGPNVYTEVWDQKQPILRLFASPTYLWKRPHFEAIFSHFLDCVDIIEFHVSAKLTRDWVKSEVFRK